MDKKITRKHNKSRGPPVIAGIVVSILFVALILGVLVYFDAQKQVLVLLQWIEVQGGWALVLFALIMALVVVLILPGVLFTTGAGFVFGVLEGTLCVVVGTTFGAMLAFLISRHLFGSQVAQYVLSHEKLKSLNDEITPNGWKLVLLTRLIPFFPFKLSNYFFGLTQVSLRGFFAGTFIGIIPNSIHSVYLGSIAADITTLGLRHTERTSLEWGLYIGGFIASIAAVLYLTRLARHAMMKNSTHTKAGDKPCHG